MRNYKVLIVSAVVIAYLIGAWFAGQYMAGALYFVLNKTMPEGIELNTWATYWEWYQNDPKQGKYLKVSAALSGFALLVVPMIIAMAAGGPKRGLHGDARWARPDEIRKSGLLTDKTGILVGQYRGRYLTYPGQQFVMLAAPTRSGKGVGVIIPNLLSYPDSVVVLDIKFENFYLTSRFRELHGHQCYLFAPFDQSGRTHRWNPYDAVSKDINQRGNDLLAIGRALWPGRDPKSAFWDDQAVNLFLGLSLYLLDTPELPTTFGEVLRQSSGKGQPPKDYVASIIKERTGGDRPLSDECLDALNRFCSAPDNTLGNIISTFTAPLTIFSSPILDAATSTSDFKLEDVRRKRMSIYIGVQPKDLSNARTLVNLFFTQLVNLNTTLPQQDPSLKYQCLLVMDEFTSIGKVGIIASANAFIAGYNLRLLTIVQSIAQLEAPDAYGKDDARTLMTNHDLKIVYPPVDQRDANEVSETLGSFTERAKSMGSSRARAQFGGGSISENFSEQRRALMMPQELREMSQDQEIVILRANKPILCEKIIYYKDPVFLARLKEASPTLATLGKAVPTQKQLEEALFVNLEGASKVPVNDLNLFRARREGRTREMEEGEELSPAKLALSLPMLNDPNNPSQDSLAALIEAVFRQTGFGESAADLIADVKLSDPQDEEAGGTIEPVDSDDATDPETFARAKTDTPDDLPEFGPDDSYPDQPDDGPDDMPTAANQ